MIRRIPITHFSEQNTDAVSAKLCLSHLVPAEYIGRLELIRNGLPCLTDLDSRYSLVWYRTDTAPVRLPLPNNCSGHLSGTAVVQDATETAMLLVSLPPWLQPLYFRRRNGQSVLSRTGPKAVIMLNKWNCVLSP